MSKTITCRINSEIISLLLRPSQERERSLSSLILASILVSLHEGSNSICHRPNKSRIMYQALEIQAGRTTSRNSKSLWGQAMGTARKRIQPSSQARVLPMSEWQRGLDHRNHRLGTSARPRSGRCLPLIQTRTRRSKSKKKSEWGCVTGSNGRRRRHSKVSQSRCSS